MSGFIAVIVSPERQIVCLGHGLPRPGSGHPAVSRGDVGPHGHLGPHRLGGLLVPGVSRGAGAGLLGTQARCLTPPSVGLLVFIACLYIFLIRD